MPRITRPLPLFCTGFTQLRRLDAVYVDKTAWLPDLCRNSSMIFLARPRRFGKTLLVSTFESLFRHGLRDFSGLAVEKVWTDRTYPVIRLDFSMAKAFESMDGFEARLEILFSRALREAGFEVPDGHRAAEYFFTLLSRSDFSSLVLLIDEYDAPLTAHLNDPELFEQAQQRLSQFYSDIKSYGSRLRFLFMTGITKLSNTGIFSDFNNLMDISLHPKYGALLGYTEAEMRADFAPYIERAAQALGLSDEDVVTKLRRHYNGYCFDEAAACRVYCPWSVLNFLDQPSRGFRNYWYESGGHPSVLMGYLKAHSLGDPKSYAQPKELNLSDLSSSQPYASLQLEALLFETGYLAIKSVSANGVATLGYPNEEVAQSMAQLFAEALLGGKPYKEPSGPSLAQLLASGSLDDIAARFNDVFNSLDYQCFPVRDEASCRAMLQVLMIGAKLVPNVENHSAQGRSDLEVTAGGRRWVFEIKYARRKAEVPKLLAEGAAQMKARRYGETAAGKSADALMRAVIVFSSEKRKFDAWTLV